MNSWNGNVRQYESKEAKSNRAIIIIIILLFGVVFYKITKADAKPDIVKDSNESYSSNISVNDTQIEDNVDLNNKVLSASDNTFSIDTFFQDIQTTYDQYNFTTEETTFSWNQKYGAQEIKGKKIWAYIQVGDFKLESECRQYLQDASLIVSAENASGSDAGESKQGFTNSSQVCILETQTTDDTQKSLYEISCGNI